jgi:hypothetical protein
MFTTKNPIDIIAAIGLGLGAVFGMAGTFVAQPGSPPAHDDASPKKEVIMSRRLIALAFAMI